MWRTARKALFFDHIVAAEREQRRHADIAADADCR